MLIGIGGNAISPKGLSGQIAFQLKDLPFTRKHVENLMGNSPTNAISSVALHNKKFSNRVNRFIALIREAPNQYKSCQLAIYLDKKRMPGRITPILVEIRIAKKALFVYIGKNSLKSYIYSSIKRFKACFSWTGAFTTIKVSSKDKSSLRFGYTYRT